MANDTKTSGYLERRILHRMRVAPDEKPKSSNQGPELFAVSAGDIEGWHGASRASARRAFQSLREKGLIMPVEERPRSPERMKIIYEQARPSDDGRVQDWTITQEGMREIGRLEAEYFDALEGLLKQYGRHPVQLKERFG